MDKIGPLPEPVLPILSDGNLTLPISVGMDGAADGLLLPGKGSQSGRTEGQSASPENSSASLPTPLSGEGGNPLPGAAYTLRLGSDESTFLLPDAEGRPRPVSSYDSFGRSTIKPGVESPSAADSRPGTALFRFEVLPEYFTEMNRLLWDDQPSSQPGRANPSAYPETVSANSGEKNPPSNTSSSPAIPDRSVPRAPEGTADPIRFIYSEVTGPNASVAEGKDAMAPGSPAFSPKESGSPASSSQGDFGQDPDTPVIKAGSAFVPEAPDQTVSLPATAKLPVRPAEGRLSQPSEAFDELAERPASNGASETERVFSRSFYGSYNTEASPLRREMPLPYAFAPFGDISSSLRRRVLGEEEPSLPPMEEGGTAASTSANFLRLSEAIRMACVLHNQYNGSDVRFEIEVPWDGSYVRFATQSGMIRGDEFPNYNAFATRAEAVYLFSRCVPAVALPALRSSPLPSDVRETDWFAEGVARLLRAGVLDCVDRMRCFFPDHLITRSEAALLLGRIATPSDRRRSGSPI